MAYVTVCFYEKGFEKKKEKKEEEEEENELKYFKQIYLQVLV